MAFMPASIGCSVPGGRLASYDVVAGEGGPLLYPVPWAREPEISHVVTEAAMCRALEGAGFEITGVVDATEAGAAFFAQRKTDAAPPPPHALSAILGADFPRRSANLGRNLAERRARVVQVIARRRG